MFPLGTARLDTIVLDENEVQEGRMNRTVVDNRGLLALDEAQIPAPVI